MNRNDTHVHTCTPPQLLSVPDPFLSQHTSFKRNLLANSP